jgi:hypothetical protein
MLKVKSSKDFLAGLLFVAFGIAALVLGREYPFGSASAMGPGFFPRVLAVALIVLGAVLSGRGLTLHGEKLDSAHIRPLIFVLGAILAFAFLIEKVGLIVTGLVVTILAALAYRGRMTVFEVGILAVTLTVFCVALFIYLLGLPIPVVWQR